MNNLKNVLGTLAFMVAIGVAFAGSNASYGTAYGKPSGYPCTSGTLEDGRFVGSLPGQCSTNFTGHRCEVTVKISFFTFTDLQAYHPNGSCAVADELYIQ